MDADTIEETFATLDHREKNGYERYSVQLQMAQRANAIPAITYIAPAGNHAYLGPAPLAALAAQIRTSQGPSGRNVDYLFALAQALRELDAHDPHVFELLARLNGDTA